MVECLVNSIIFHIRISLFKLDFAGDFIEMLNDDNVSLAEKKEEVQGYREVCSIHSSSSIIDASDSIA